MNENKSNNVISIAEYKANLKRQPHNVNKKEQNDNSCSGLSELMQRLYFTADYYLTTGDIAAKEALIILLSSIHDILINEVII